jgi:hypothetical protein
MTWLSDLLSTHGTTLLYASAAAVISWLATNMIAKPVLEIRQKRVAALQIADRYGHVTEASGEENVQSARAALADVAAELRALSRGSRAVRYYCNCLDTTSKHL